MARVPRVIFLHPDLGLGGAERLIVDAACALQDHGFDVVIVTAHHDPTRSFDETNSRLVVKVAGDWIPRHVGGKFHLVCALLRTSCAAMVHIIRPLLERGETPDVIIVDQIAQVLPLVKALTFVPTLFYCHYPDKLLAPRTGSMARRAYRRVLDGLEECTTGLADSCLVNSRFTESVFRQVFTGLATMPLTVLNPCVDLKALRVAANVDAFAQLPPNLRYALGLNQRCVFLSINRFERKKGVEVAIEAAKLVDGMLLVVAGGYDPRVQENCDYKDELFRLAVRLGIQDRVFFVTSVSHEVKAFLLDLCVALVYTPQNEHFGIVPLEAAAARRPVIACDSGGPRETVVSGRTGFLVQPTPTGFAEAMRKFMGREGTQRARLFGEEARKHVEGRFSREQFGDELDRIVRRLVRPQPWPSPSTRARLVAACAVAAACALALWLALCIVQLLVRW